MKKIKKIVSVLTASLILVLSVPAPAPAAGSFSYITQARTLYDLGLYKGVSTTTFDPDLGTALDRQTGVVMLLRIFGLEKKAGALTDAEVASALAVFTDADSIESWAKKPAAYAVKNGLVHGISNDTFGPNMSLSGKMYCTLILRQLGYTANYDSAPAQLSEKGGLTAAEAVKFNERPLIKDDLVGISYGSLQARYENGQSVIAKLVEEKVVSEAKAALAGLVVPGAASRTGRPTVTGLKAGDAAITGTAEAGATITVKRNGTEIGRGTADGNGYYTVTLIHGVALAENDRLSITATSPNKSASEAVSAAVAAASAGADPTVKTGEGGAPTAFLTVGSSVINEDQSNNGSITEAQSVVLSNGAFAAFMDGGVIVNKLPYGLLINVVRDSDNRITITFSGNAVAHTNANDVGNASVTVMADRITGAADHLTSNNFAFNFND